MNDNERKDVHELEAWELVREIATALDYALVYGQGIDENTDDGIWFLMRANECYGHVWSPDGIDQAWRNVEYLDDSTQSHSVTPFKWWPADDGAAFRLVREVRDRLTDKASGSYWSLEFPGTKSQLLRRYVTDDRIAQGMETDGETARALSELAALALRQMVVPPGTKRE